MKKVILIGAGGYAKSVLDCIEESTASVIAGFLDSYKEDTHHMGIPILGKDLDVLENPLAFDYFICIGDNQMRKLWYEQLVERGCELISVIDKTAIVSPHATIGSGCFVGRMAIVNSQATIDEDSIINTKALVEHGCRIAKHVNISTNTVLNGDVAVGEGSFVGSSAVVRGQLAIGQWAVVGAGSVVTKNVPDHLTVVGIPAHELKKEEPQL